MPFMNQKKNKMEKSGFSNVMYIIVAVYYTTFESLLVYKSSRRLFYVLETATFRNFEL